MMGGFGFGPLGWVGMILNLVVSVAVLGGLIWLVVWGVRRVSSGEAGVGPTSLSPREIAQARYARGELTREQYQQLLADLS